MIALGNHNGAVLPGELYANKDGVIYNEDAFDIEYKINDRMVPFPQKPKCVLNLTGLTFSILSGCGRNAYINRKSSSVRQYNTIPSPYDVETFTRSGLRGGVLTNRWSSENVSGDINNIPVGNLQYSGLTKTLFKPDEFASAFRLKGDWNRYSTTSGGNKFTFSSRFRANRNPINYRSLIRFSDLRAGKTASLRFEWGDNMMHLYSRDGRSEGNSGRLDLTKFHTYTVTVDGTTVKMYLDGVLKTTGTISLGPLRDVRELSLGSYAGRYNGQTQVGCNMEFSSIRLWDCTLTDEEVSNIYKIDRAGW